MLKRLKHQSILALDNTLYQQDPQFSHPFYSKLFSLISFILSTFSFAETIAFSFHGDKGEHTPIFLPCYSIFSQNLWLSVFPL